MGGLTIAEIVVPILVGLAGLVILGGVVYLLGRLIAPPPADAIRGYRPYPRMRRPRPPRPPKPRRRRS